MLLLIRTGDIRVQRWFVVFDNLEGDVVFGPPFEGTCKKFPTRRTLFPWHPMFEAMITMKMAINLVYTVVTVFNMRTNPFNDVLVDEFNLSCVE